MRRLAGAIPGPELLSLGFGVFAASAINVLTSLALGSVSRDIATATSVAAIGLITSTIGVGGLAMLASKAKEAALLSGAGGLTRSELHSQIRYELEQVTGWIATLVALVVIGIGTVGVGAALGSNEAQPPADPLPTHGSSTGGFRPTPNGASDKERHAPVAPRGKSSPG